MQSTFERLYGEPDIPAKIFAELNPKDVCQVELVCKDWRNIVSGCSVWKKILQKKFDNDQEWKLLLTHHGWTPNERVSHSESKSLLMKIQGILGPDEMTVGMLRYITNNTLVKPNDFDLMSHNQITGTKKSLSPWDEDFFLSQRHNDHVKIMSRMPKTSRGMGMPWQKTGPRKTNLSHDGEHYSNLILFGPTAFPILITSKNYVAAAGARYGKGRLVVLPHEAVLCHGGLMQGAIEWCANKANARVSMDPLTKAWTRNGWQYKDVKRTRRDPPFEVTYIDRDKINQDYPVYITEGHYEDHADHLMEYVRNGGSMIIGGHAWWWASNDIDVAARQKCSMLEHPGNKIIARAGIVFSSEGIQQNNIEFEIDQIPALQHSLYFALKTCLHRPSYVFRQYIFDTLLKGNEYEDIQLFSEQLRNNDNFKIILHYMYEIQKRPF